MVRSFRNLVLVLAAAGLTLFAGAVFAQSSALPVPVGIQPVGPASGGLSTVATFDARGVGAAANAGYYSRPVLVSNNTLGGLARGLLRRSVPVAAMSAAIAAAGWVIDELTQQVMVPGQPSQDFANTVWCGRPFGSTTLGCANSPEALGAALASRSTGPSAPYTFSSWNGSTRLYFCGAGGGCAASIIITSYPVADPATWPHPNWNPGSLPQPVSDPDLGQVVRDNPNLWNHALRNPDGSVNRNPDVMAEAQALAQELAAANPSPDPTAEWDTGYQGGEPQPQGQTSLEFPNFCAWASKVCDLADWLRDDQTEFDQDNEVPEISPDLSVSWNSGFSGGSCPAPLVVDAMGTDVEFSYQPLCDAASYIRPIVLAGAALLCVFIIGGFRRAS